MAPRIVVPFRSAVGESAAIYRSRKTGGIKKIDELQASDHCNQRGGRKKKEELLTKQRIDASGDRRRERQEGMRKDSFSPLDL